MRSGQGRGVGERLAQMGQVGDLAQPVLEVMNKKDLEPELKSLRGESLNRSRIALSAATGDGVDDLLRLLVEWLQQDMHELHLKLHISDGRSLAYCHQHGSVISKQVDESVVDVVVRMKPADAGKFIQQDGVHQLQ